MNKIILASNNKHKIDEIKQMLPNFEILSLNDIGFNDDIVEDADNYEGNALLKAQAVFDFLKSSDSYILADDSGLSVDSLNGEPGIYSARYSGEHGNDEANRQRLLKELNNNKDRKAHFVCCLCLFKPDGTYQFVRGETDGEILKQKMGDDSFGYDCLFYSYDLKKSFGEASHEEKNSVSHRARALQKLKEIL